MNSYGARVPVLRLEFAASHTAHATSA